MRTAKSECIRRKSFFSIEEARRQVEEFVRYYNHTRLHSAISHITPADMLAGKRDEIWKNGEEKLEKDWDEEGRVLQPKIHLNS